MTTPPTGRMRWFDKFSDFEMENIEIFFYDLENIDDYVLDEIERRISVYAPRNPQIYFRNVDPFCDYTEAYFKARFV